MKDYYKILGISKTATDKEISKAYKSLSMKYHPDRPNGNEEKFKEINEANEVLSDPIKRMQYNQGKKPTGSNPETGDYFEDEPTSRQQFRSSNGSTRFNIPREFNFSNSDTPFGENFFQNESPFDNIFNNVGFSGFPFQEQEKPRAPEYILNLSFEDMYSGGVHKVEYPRQLHVDGENVTIMDSTEFKVPSKCYVGKKFKLTIPDDNGKEYSIIIKVEPKKHNFFNLHNSNNSDLELTMSMTLKSSLVGFKLKMRGIDGEQIMISDDIVIDPRIPYKLEGKGFINKEGKRGDLYINFNIKYPNKLTERQRAQLKNIL